MKETIHYLLKETNRKSLALRVNAEGEIEVLAPKGCPKRDVDAFVLRSKDWIEKQRAKREASRARAEEQGVITTEEELHALSEKMIEALKTKLPHYAKLIGVTYGRVTVRNQRTKWGSCSAQGNLNFNVLLMLAPEDVLDYVVVHELCHRKHMDHSKDFWALVESVLPDYKKSRKWLKDNGETLQRRLTGQ